MTRKQKAAIVAAVTALVGALGLGVNGQVLVARGSERVRALEVRLEEREKSLDHRFHSVDRQLEGIALKLDRLIERGR